MSDKRGEFGWEWGDFDEAHGIGGFESPKDLWIKRADVCRTALIAAQERVKVLEIASWRNMDSAPKDGKEFLIRYPLQGNVMELCRWDKIYKRWNSKGNLIYPEDQKCFWVAIPALTPPPSRGNWQN